MVDCTPVKSTFPVVIDHSCSLPEGSLPEGLRERYKAVLGFEPIQET
jgi:hypothetical protein